MIRFCFCTLLLYLAAAGSVRSEVTGNRIPLKVRPTITAFEMDTGDTAVIELMSGRQVTLSLKDAAAAVIWTNRDTLDPNKKKNKYTDIDNSWYSHVGRTMYHFTGTVIIDGHTMQMERYVGPQETFYVPYTVNGLRIWFDAVQDIFIDHGGIIDQKHGRCMPHKRARFAVQDMTLDICPEKLHAWYPDDELYIDAERCFSGDDMWMGAYLGRSAHGGLDIDMRKGAPHWAPIDLDFQYLRDAVARGANNNRWRGFHTWPDGSEWMLHVAHVQEMTIPESTDVKAGQQFATGAGKMTWWHDHAHFVFGVTNDSTRGRVLIDPWILFWARFEQVKRQKGVLRAGIQPLAPAACGKAVTMEGTGPETAWFFWTFGDGATAAGRRVQHTFTRPGIYPVTLTLQSQDTLATMTQHITVNGTDADVPVLTVTAPDEPSFRKRPVQAMDVYGHAPRELPHTLSFLARPSRPRPEKRTLLLSNAGGGTLDKAAVSIAYAEKTKKWLEVKRSGTGNDQTLAVRVDGTGLEPGIYRAGVTVTCRNSPDDGQTFHVYLDVPAALPAAEVMMDDRDPGCYTTPWFWMAHKFHGYGWPRRGPWMNMYWPYEYEWADAKVGYRHRYLTGGMRPREGEFVRFTPDLRQGTYEVVLSDKVDYKQGTAFNVRVHHAGRDTVVRFVPARSLAVGTFTFDEGADGFVELLAAGAAGPVLADAVRFRPVGQP